MLHLDDGGVGEPVLVVPGFPVDPIHMTPVVRTLGDSWRALLAHPPGYGASPPLEPYSWEAAHELVAQALLRRSVDRLAVVAWSAGAWRAVRLTLDSRFSVRGLYLLAPRITCAPEQRAAYLELAEAVRDGRFDSGEFARLMFPEAFRLTHPEATADVTRWIEAVPRSRLADEMAAFAAAKDLQPALADVRCPVHVRTGALDVLAPVAESRAIVAATRGRLEEVGGVGHGLLFEDEPATCTSIRGFLESIR